MSTNQLLINPKFIRKLALGISLCSIYTVSSVHAKDYMVEVLVFENINASKATESHSYSPPKRMKAGSKAWLIEPTMLNSEAESIKNSSDYQLMHHYSWGVESLPYEESANYTIIETQSQGYIKIYADQLLFTNIDLDYKGFRMKEKRRLKLNDKHFFDHPKFGLLMQVSRLPKSKPVDDSEN